jgi:hypothetical protein
MSTVAEEEEWEKTSPPQPKPKRAAKEKASKAEEAPPQQGKVTKARKVAKPATRRSTTAK